MKTRYVITIVILALVAAFAGVVSMRVFDPIIGAPGGRLSGSEEARPPADWSAAAAISTAQLETRPDDPYSVNVWGAGLGEYFYVTTRAEGATWSRFIDTNPDVRLRLGDTIYNLRAVRVDDDVEGERVLVAYASKYESDPESMTANAGLIYRLEGR